MPQMGVFHFTPIVLVAGLIALPYLWLVMPRLLPDNSVEDLHDKRRFHTLLRVGSDSILLGADISSVLPRLPKDIRFHDGQAGLVQPHQRLRISGKHEALEDAVRVLKGELATDWVLDRIRRESASKQQDRSEEHTSELQSLMRISYAVFCLKKKNTQ